MTREQIGDKNSSWDNFYSFPQSVKTYSELYPQARLFVYTVVNAARIGEHLGGSRDENGTGQSAQGFERDMEDRQSVGCMREIIIICKKPLD